MSPVLELEPAGSVFRAYISLQLIAANKKTETGIYCPSFVCFDFFPPFLLQIPVMFFPESLCGHFSDLEWLFPCVHLTCWDTSSEILFMSNHIEVHSMKENFHPLSLKLVLGKTKPQPCHRKGANPPKLLILPQIRNLTCKVFLGD